MGGVFFDCGNRSPAAEFNVHADSASALSLLEFCRRPVVSEVGELRESVPLTFVGLDVTHRAVLWRSMVENGEGELAELVRGLTGKYMDFYSKVLGPKGCPLHDPLAVALALHPEYCVRERYHVEVVTTPTVPETDGITIADYRPAVQFRDRMKELTQVCVSVDYL